MKLLTKLAQASTAVVVLASLALGTHSVAAATGTGQIVTGNNNYQIADITKGADYANPQSADACDTLGYRLRLYNPGPSALGDVKVEAGINTMTKNTTYVSTATAYTPDGAVPSSSFQATLNISSAQTQSYVAGSTKLLDSAGNVLKSSANGTLADTVTMGAGGIDIGGVGESVTEYLEFQTKLSCPPTPPPTPTFACTELGITAEDNRTVKVSSFSTSATNGAVFKNAVITWGDNSAALTSASPVGQTHQYAANGTYLVTATAHFTVNGQDVTASGLQCEKQVTFTPTTPPSVTPPTTPPATPAAPTALVNTGPGSVAGLFAAATAIGTLGYRKMLGRRLGNQ